MMHLIKNPIIFGVIAGVVLCILLFAHDKFLNKKPEDKATLSTYAKIFAAGFVTVAPLAFLVYNRDISFKTNTGSTVDKVVKDVIQDAGVVPVSSASIGDELSNLDPDQVVESVKPRHSSSKHSSSRHGSSKSGKPGYTDTPDM